MSELREIFDIFFKAAMNGYAAGASKSPIQGIPGGKMIVFEENDFRVVDVYFTTPGSDWSWGSKQIAFQGEVVWFMQYHGFYPARVIAFLKKALVASYQDGVFNGGRGPAKFVGGDGLVYGNNCYSGEATNAQLNQFLDFQGREEIRRLSDQRALGFHEFRGGMVSGIHQKLAR
jgi:hypothetical protein